jgi:Icc protein
MPSFLDLNSDRRHFLKTIGLGAASIALAPRAFAQDDAAKKEFHVAWISDTHIPADPTEVFRKFNPVDNLKRIAPEVVAAKPDLVIHVGDGARLEGKVEDYKQLSDLMKPMMEAAPVCITLGNHDDRTNFGTVFKAVAGEKQKVTGKQVVVLEHEVARFVVLDSLLFTNKTTGLLGKAQRTWLSNYLPAVKDRPVVVVVHHSLEDTDGDLADVDRMFEIFKPNDHVKAIFYGHSHIWAMTERQNVKLINLPAVGYNFQDKEPVGWVDSRFTRAGCELTMHAIGGNTADDGKKFEIKWA